MNQKYNFFVIVLILNLVIIQRVASEVVQNERRVSQSDIKNIYDKNWTFSSHRKCGLMERNLYISNGTFESVQFQSDRQFSLFVEEDAETFSFTGFALGKQISLTELNKQENNHPKFYKIKRPFSHSLNSSQNTSITSNNPKLYLSSLSIYGNCKTVAVSTILKEIVVQVRFFESQENHDIKDQYDKDMAANNDKSQADNDNNTLIIKIPAILYCVGAKPIKQANFFVTKLYYTLLMCCFGLLLNFKPLRYIPLILRLTILVTFLWISFQIKTCYQALISTYTLVFLLVFFYRIFELRGNYSQSYLRQLMLSKSFVIVSLASAVPLAIKSHLDDQSLEQKRILLHVVNIVMICNIMMFVSSIFNLNRFRHAFYYFLVFALTEHFFSNQFENLLVFNILQIQMFPDSFECDSLFFIVMLIPLCDFFFKSYSSQSIYKFFIILIPIIVKPYRISCSLSFGIGISIWALNEAFKGKDLIKIIRYKR